MKINIKIVLFVILIIVIVYLNLTFRLLENSLSSSNNTDSTSSYATRNIQSKNKNFDSSEACINLFQIREAGLFFPDTKAVHNEETLSWVEPSFRFGSQFQKGKAPHHMGGDQDMFTLIKENVSNRIGGISIDAGSNQGFYTYYLAALGLDVYGFEIDEQNFKSLQHGLVYNTKEISDRVHLFPMGLSDHIGRSGRVGGGYTGFLSNSMPASDINVGPILSVTFDCFSQHVQPELKDVAFVKVDVEGFEIAVLKGAQNSLLSSSNKKNRIGSFLMEVGPARWNRADISFEDGVQEIRNLAKHFEQGFILLRKPTAGFAKTCPLTLANNFADKNPRELTSNYLHKVMDNEWGPLLKEMEKSDFDCNVWFINPE